MADLRSVLRCGNVAIECSAPSRVYALQMRRCIPAGDQSRIHRYLMEYRWGNRLLLAAERLWIWSVGWGLVTTISAAESSPAGHTGLDSVRPAAAAWVRVRSEMVAAEAEWAREKTWLLSWAPVLEARAAQLENRTQLLEVQQARAESGLAELRESAVGLQKALAAEETALLAAVGELQRLSPRLPPRLGESLTQAFTSLGEQQRPAAERLQFAVNVLARALQFNREIVGGEEKLLLAGESAPCLVEVVYLGLSRAYALDRPKRRAFVGAPGRAAWEWQLLPGAADAVDRLIAVQRGERDPEFVRVPGPRGEGATP
ncbi:DUF3450 family protein [Oleiharenicola lentus]|uniref:DUF3450 family protein n=1 Tax=Oleiharenicola lentus TaxID=2508720 RepID=A0A4Q1CBA5_9BACT|nr:DUF3450 family protein [Oleiharenicola lentus]RXK56383.1 DUF3450 family protein [Oleiharenicola lentus]